jgi:hypothetical protein
VRMLAVTFVLNAGIESIAYQLHSDSMNYR